MVWNEQALGWVADWRLGSRDESYGWQVRGVGFDDAFRNAMAGAAQILSGNGRPTRPRLEPEKQNRVRSVGPSQVGPDQDGVFDLFERELAPALRDRAG